MRNLVNAGTIDPRTLKEQLSQLQRATFRSLQYLVPTIAAGSSASYTVTISSMNGFAGTVNLGTAVSPSFPKPGVDAKPFKRYSNQRSTATSTLTVST